MKTEVTHTAEDEKRQTSCPKLVGYAKLSVHLAIRCGVNGRDTGAGTVSTPTRDCIFIVIGLHAEAAETDDYEENPLASLVHAARVEGIVITIKGYLESVIAIT